MPKYTPTEEDMQSLYSDDAQEGGAAETEVEMPAEAGSEMEGEGGETEAGETESDDAETLVSKAQLPKGAKEGDVVSFKVVKDYGDEVGLEMVKQTSQANGDSESVESEIDALDKE